MNTWVPCFLMSVCYEHVGAFRSHERVSDELELQLQAVVS